MGLVTGVVIYLGRTPVLEEHRAGTADWGTHLVLTGVALVLLALAAWWHRRRSGAERRLLLLAPLGRRAQRRVRHTISQVRRPTVALRCLAALVPAALMAYLVFRAAVQITAGLDPNFTVNAWGGPSYFGAMFCHYLDAALLLSVAGGLLHLLLLPDPGQPQD